MKRFYTLALSLMIGVTTLFAQKTTDLQFVTITGEGDKAVETGTVKDGAVIEVSELRDFENDIYAGLALKNVSGSDEKFRLGFEILELDNGNFSCCFMGNCRPYEALGKYYRPDLVMNGEYIMPNSFLVLKSGKFEDLASEWKQAGKGKCVVKFTAYKGELDEENSDSEMQAYNIVEGPSVTVHFLNGVPSGINNIENQNVDNNYYDLAGRRVAKPTKGIYVKNNKKVIVK